MEPTPASTPQDFPQPSSQPSPQRPPLKRSSSLVLISGLATSLLALFGVWLLNATTDFNIMGYYLNKFLPIGALGVGLVASAGYGLAAWKTGIRMTRTLVLIVCALLVAAYFVAQYLEFRSQGTLQNKWTGEQIGFFRYFDVTTRLFAWQTKDGSPSTPLGLWGYGLRALELIGFALGGLIVPAGLRSTAYCDACQLYMRNRSVGYIPASVPAKKIGKKDTEAQAAYEAEQQQAIDRGKADLDALLGFVKEDNMTGLQNALAALQPKQKETLKLPAHINVKMTYCDHCHGGRFEPTLQAGSGNSVRLIALGSTELPADMVAALVRKDS